MANIEYQKPHAIMISYLLQGHIIPFVNLAVKLASKGFSITFAHLDFIHHQISNSQSNTETDIFTQARNSGLDIAYSTISDGFPVDFNRPANLNQYIESLIRDFPNTVDDFVKKVIRSSPGSKFFLVSDTFYEWPAKIAKRYDLVNVSFWTQSALVFSLYYYLDLLRENGHVPVNGREVDVDYVPGIRSINTIYFMSHYHDSEMNMLNESIFSALGKVKSADFILCNTVEELEKETVSALQEKQPFYAVGPIFPSDFSRNLVPRSILPESDCTEWLKAKSSGSVLYVSFGSLAKTDKNVILEIASGLLLSEVNFIWVLRPGTVESDADDILPEGFMDSIKERGLIVPWCNQNQVLLNPAIGGFLTHCGWNSILESIWCNVPILCYPIFTDQPTNRKLVVDDWGIGMNLCDGECVRREEVGEKIKSLMNGKKSDELKQEIKKVKQVLENTLSDDGSSEKNFDCFVKDVMDEIERRCEKV